MASRNGSSYLRGSWSLAHNMRGRLAIIVFMIYPAESLESLTLENVQEILCAIQMTLTKRLKRTKTTYSTCVENWHHASYEQCFLSIVGRWNLRFSCVVGVFDVKCGAECRPLPFSDEIRKENLRSAAESGDIKQKVYLYVLIPRRKLYRATICVYVPSCCPSFIHILVLVWYLG